MNKEELEIKIKEGYEALGKAFYENHKNDNPANNKYEELFRNIKPFYDEYEAIISTELAEKGLKKCSVCGATPTIESIYCHMCGHKFDNEPQSEEVKLILAHICPYCNSKLEDNSTFCSTCGQRL